MARGSPDWYPNVKLSGQHDTTLVPVKVDENGQLYIAMTGQSLSVDNLPSDYFKSGENIGNVGNMPSDYFKSGEDTGAIQGKDGETKRYVAVDASGIILSRMKGAYGAVLKDISVDDVGILLSRMKGAYGEVLKDIAVDTNGNIIAMMKGEYSGALKTIALDTNGIMKANLSVQDLDFLTVRPAYGNACLEGDSKICPDGDVTTLETISGRGVTCGGWCAWSSGNDVSGVVVQILVDGNLLAYSSAASLYALGITKPDVSPTFLTKYIENTVNSYTVGIDIGITFESSYVVKISNSTGFDVTVGYFLFYALTP